MNKSSINPAIYWLGTVVLLLPVLLSGCGSCLPEIRYSHNTNKYTVGQDKVASASAKTVKYRVGKCDGVTAYYISRDGDYVAPKYDQQNNPQPPVDQLANLPMVLEVSDVLFEFDKWVIKTPYWPELDRWAEYFLNNPEVTAEVHGHTDSMGTAQYNLVLSERRAQAVINYLVNKGIERNRLSHKGFGETKPIAPNDTEENRQKNRRVEMSL